MTTQFRALSSSIFFPRLSGLITISPTLLLLPVLYHLWSMSLPPPPSPPPFSFSPLRLTYIFLLFFMKYPSAGQATAVVFGSYRSTGQHLTVYVIGKECNWVKFHLLCYLSCTGPSRANWKVRRPVGKPTAHVGLKIQGNSLKPVLCGKVACTYRCAKTRCLASLRKNNYRIYRAVRAVTAMTNNSRPKCVSCRAILIHYFLNKQTSDHTNPQVINFPVRFVYEYSKCKYQVRLDYEARVCTSYEEVLSKQQHLMCSRQYFLEAIMFVALQHLLQQQY